jgi:hypothetical protein
MSLKDRSPSCRRDLPRRLAAPIMPAGPRRRDRDRDHDRRLPDATPAAARGQLP